jgi:cell division transport system permease protein
MPWVIAIMVALTVLAAAAGLSLRNTAVAARDELSGGVTVQVLEPRPDVRRQQAAAVRAALLDTPGVLSARVVPQEELDALIEPWLGQQATGSGDIPVPALIDARLDGAIGPGRLEALRERLRVVAPAARVDAQSTWLRPVFGAIAALQWLALALIALLALATAAAVLLAARTALGANRDTIEIVHLLGGTDAQIARVFQRSIGFDAVGGGAVGLGLALVVIFFVGQRFAALGTGMVDGGGLGWHDWLVIAAIPFLGVILATVTARLTVMRALRQML